ncbi:MAG: carboxynorspermidine decarboxylase [Oscillospiraceae bacterium]|nr:carboxynorspermidine decarboxylase [Oscillospiraceae bacterium]
MNWITKVDTPCYVIDEKQLRRNLELLKYVRERAGCKILLAQKAFSAFSCYPLIAEYLDGCTASGIYEAWLGWEEMAKPFGRENHVFSPAYPECDMDELLKICDHMVFNSPQQWAKYRDKVRANDRYIQAGIRINPEYSEIETDIYNPCFTGSRLGTTLERFNADPALYEGIDGLHFHTMCEQGADVLERTLTHVEEKFGFMFDRIKWLNFGGGHHITRPGYDVEKLISCVKRIKEQYGLEVYLEPGEAVALNAGWLVTTVLDTFKNGCDIAITDASAACHMPDVLEMPYRPEIIGAGKPGEKPYTYRLGGNTCLAGDVIGDYSFDKPLSGGERLEFCDMAIYSMCKNNTFNGMPLPSIYILKENGEIQLVKKFGYEDFKGRLS